MVVKGCCINCAIKLDNGKISRKKNLGGIIVIVYIVGDKPSDRMRAGAKPFEGALCEPRLKAWIERLGITEYFLLNRVDWPFGFPDRQTQGVFIALGAEASKMLARCKYEHFRLPHPSGRNRQLNDNDFVDKKLTECRDWLNQGVSNAQ